MTTLRLLWRCFGLGLCGALAATPQLLHPSGQIQDRIELSQNRQYVFDLSAGTFLEATVKSSTATLELRLLDPLGKQMVLAPTRALTIVPSAGRYRLNVSCAPNAMAGGSYLVDVFVNPTPGTPQRDLVHAAELRQRGLLEKVHSSQAAQKTFEEALTIYQSLGDGLGQRETWRSMATLARASGDYTAAGTYFEREIASARTDLEPVSETHALYLWGTMFVDRDRQQALHLFEQSLAAARQIDNLAWRVIVLNAAAAMSMPAEIDRALVLLREAKEDAIRVSSPQLRADVLLAEGNSFTYREDFQNAVDRYEEALSLYRDAGYRFGMANALDNAGSALMEIGDWDSALKALNESITLWAREENRIQEGFALHNRARVFAAQNQSERARREFLTLIPRFRESGATEAEGVTYTELGETYIAGRQPRQALECFEHAIQALDKGGTLQERGRALLLRSRAKRSLGSFQDSATDAREALRLFRELSDRNSELLAGEALARSEFLLGQKDEAAKSMTEAMNLMAGGRAELRRPALQTAYFVTRASFTEFYIQVLMACGRVNDAFVEAERFRARDFIDSLDENGRRRIMSAADTKWAAEDESLRRKLRQESATLTALQPKDQAPVRRRIDDLLKQRDRLAETTRTDPNRAVALARDEPLETTAVQRLLLASNTVLVEFFLAEPHSYAWVLNGSGLRAVTLPGRNVIEKAANRVRASMAAFAPPAGVQSPAQLRQHMEDAVKEAASAAADLNALTLAGLSPVLHNQRLAIAPDGALWYTPWAILRSSQSSEVVVVPSATAVVRLSTSRHLPPSRQLAVFGDPVYDKTDARLSEKSRQNAARQLPVSAGANAETAEAQAFGRLRFSREEALAISKFVSSDQLLLALDFDASREAAASAGLEQYRVVHYAAHTLLNNERPELSGIVLSLIDRNGKMQDGFLRLFDIYHLHLRADLVVLSGCRTALGKELRGEGLVGLTQGFLSAGANQILASLWPVEDRAAAEFMTRFYEALLKKKMPASKALRAAQESMGREPAWGAPYYWAAFQLVGDLQ